VPQTLKPSGSQIVLIRDLAYHVRTWGEADAPKLFMLHGWMDVGASFQFLVDAFERDWHVVAPDWRGFGRSAWCADGYWFADYIADLEAILDVFAPTSRRALSGTASAATSSPCMRASVPSAARRWFRSTASAFLRRMRRARR